ncbi:hypothetical protein D3C85_1362030 [compost metagenome]
MRQHAGQHRQALISIHQRRTEYRSAAEHRTDTRHDFSLVTLGQTIVQVHVGTVEERVTFTDHRDVTAGVEMRGQLLAGRIVEIADHLLIRQRRR